MTAFAVHTPAGTVEVEAASSQVDSSGALGFHGPDGRMVRVFWPGEWQENPVAANDAGPSAHDAAANPDIT